MCKTKPDAAKLLYAFEFDTDGDMDYEIFVSQSEAILAIVRRIFVRACRHMPVKDVGTFMMTWHTSGMGDFGWTVQAGPTGERIETALDRWGSNGNLEPRLPRALICTDGVIHDIDERSDVNVWLHRQHPPRPHPSTINSDYGKDDRRQEGNARIPNIGCNVNREEVRAVVKDRIHLFLSFRCKFVGEYAGMLIDLLEARMTLRCTHHLDIIRDTYGLAAEQISLDGIGRFVTGVSDEMKQRNIWAEVQPKPSEDIIIKTTLSCKKLHLVLHRDEVDLVAQKAGGSGNAVDGLSRVVRRLEAR